MGISSKSLCILLFTILLLKVQGDDTQNGTKSKLKTKTTEDLDSKTQNAPSNATVAKPMSIKSQSSSISEEAKRLAEKIKMALTEVTPKHMSIDEEVSEMHKHLIDLSPKCENQSDCPTKTCCLKTDNSEGRCIVIPHRENHICSGICPCSEGYSCRTESHDTPTENQSGICKLDGAVVGQEGAGYIPKLLLKIKEIQRKTSNATNP